MRTNWKKVKLKICKYICRSKRKQKEPVTLESLRYEMQMLISAGEMIKYIEAFDGNDMDEYQKFGNLVNYFKDAVYLHTRNLMSALTREVLTEVGKVPQGIYSEVYRDWKPAIEKFGLHLNTSRSQANVSNVRNGVHLNEMCCKFIDEVNRCWEEWINNIKDDNAKSELIKIKEECRQCAKIERANLCNLVEGNAN